MTDGLPDGENRPAKINRTGCMMLDPLTEVVVRVLVTVGIGGGEFVVDVLRNGKGRERQ